MSKGRLEAFSDGVFSIAITLLILTVTAPTNTAHLGRQLGDLWPSYVAYASSFLLIGQIWLNHHALLGRMSRIDSNLAVINLFLLMDVAVLPFPTAVVAAAVHDGAGLRLASILYGSTLAVGGLLFNLIWHYARRAGHLEPSLEPAHRRAISRRFLLGPASYLTATAVGIAAPAAALVLYLFLILFYLGPGPQHQTTAA